MTIKYVEPSTKLSMVLGFKLIIMTFGANYICSRKVPKIILTLFVIGMIFKQILNIQDTQEQYQCKKFKSNI